jgi:hypothetical protein
MEAHQKLRSILGILVIEEYEPLVGAVAVDRITRKAAALNAHSIEREA